MCNIAGYVGTGKKEAAPILLEMMRAQEGYAGGYYTGIATIHEGKLYYAKVTGDVQRLVDETDAASLPGHIGIIHSRSKSGGGDEWAHPFIGSVEGEAKIAYVANGSIGCFKPRAEEFSGIAQKLFDSGYALPSRVMIETERYSHLRDGSVAHMSDVMCQLILRNMDAGMSESDAMEQAFCEMPSEIVGLLLSTACPDRIFWSRINMPMFVATCSHGQYLSSSPTALPSDARMPTLLPPSSAGAVSVLGWRPRTFQTPPATVAALTNDVRTAVMAAVSEVLSDGEGHALTDLTKAVKPLFAAADCLPSTAAVYEALYVLQKQERLQTEIRRVAGVFEGMDAPKTFFSWITE
jgi:glucosamine 6-phosphate synthetase-like amidotransferase/phosphosugar isomerase protein